MRKYLQEIEAHGRYAIEGLPRDDTPETRLKRHVLSVRDRLAFFLWYEKPRYFPELREEGVEEADKLYAVNIRDMEAYGWGAPHGNGRPVRIWDRSHRLYLHYAMFKVGCCRADLDTLVSLCRRFASCLPVARLNDWDDTRVHVMKGLHFVAAHLVGEAGAIVCQFRPSLDDLKRALEVDECVAAMDLAWLERFPKDTETRAKLDVVLYLSERQRRRIAMGRAGGD